MSKAWKSSKKSIKMIAMDLDGTALNEAGELSPRTLTALRCAADKGICNVIATGRVLNSVPPQVLTEKSLRYLITSNGAHIFEQESGVRLYDDCIGAEAADRLAELFRDLPYLLEVFTAGRAFISRSAYDNLEEYGFSDRHNAYVRATRTPVDDILALLSERRDDIENINVNFTNDADKKSCIELLRAEKDITVTSSFPTNIELGGKHTSKARALEHICGLIGCDMSGVAAFGDSPNDLAMLKACGFSVAMENAEDEVKAEADFVTLPNSLDGVAYAIERFIL